MYRRVLCIAFALTLLATQCFGQRRGGGQSQPPSGPGSGTGSGSRPGNTPNTNTNTNGDFGSGSLSPGSIEMVVRVVLPNDRPAGENIGVELHSTAGGIVSQYFTNSQGEVSFRGISPGSYIIKVKGFNVKDTASDPIYVDSHMGYYNQYIHVEPADANENTAVKSTQGSISAADLNVPGKARKEFEKGNEAFAKGDFEKASEHYSKAVETYPKYALAYNNMGAVYMKTDDRTHAREAWVKALEADPNLAAANNNMARINLLDHEYAAAIPFAEKALAVQPTNGESLLLMCEAQFMERHYDQVVIYAKKLHSVDHQKYEMGHVLAGHALEAQNHPDQARIEYELLLKEAPSGPEAIEARKALDRLQSVAQKQ